MRPAIYAALIGLAVLATSCAPNASAAGDAASAPRECFYARQAQGFSGGEDGRVYVRTGASRMFEVEVMGCPDIDWTHRIGIDARRSSDRVCSGVGADLVIENTAGEVERCLVRSVRQLSEAEIDALD